MNPTFKVKYSHTGRPSILSERLLKAQLLIALFSVRSDRMFCEQLDTNILFRWFLDMNLEEASFAGKVPVFGILKRGGRVYTPVIPDAKSRTLMPIIREKIQPDSIVYSDCWRGHNILDVSECKHYRINHSKLFANKRNHINGIENFWNQAKRRMRKFNGIPIRHFGLFLKECEWRFNNSNPRAQLKLLKQWVKQHMG